MRKGLILPSLAIFLLFICAQQGQGQDKTAGGEQSSTNSYSYMGGKGHYLPGSPHYMAGKNHYLPDSPYYMVGKEQYLPKPSETTAEESGQGPVSNEEAISGENEEFEGQEEPIYYYYEPGISLFPVIRPKHKGAKGRSPSGAINISRIGNLNLNIPEDQFHFHPGNFNQFHQGMKAFR